MCVVKHRHSEASEQLSVGPLLPPWDLNSLTSGLASKHFSAEPSQRPALSSVDCLCFLTLSALGWELSYIYPRNPQSLASVLTHQYLKLTLFLSSTQMIRLSTSQPSYLPLQLLLWLWVVVFFWGGVFWDQALLCSWSGLPCFSFLLSSVSPAALAVWTAAMFSSLRSAHWCT